MKNIFKYFQVFMLLALTACNDAFLERPPYDDLTDENFWQTEEHLKSVANTFTSSMVGKDWLNKTEIIADNAIFTAESAYREIGAGVHTTDNKMVNSFWVHCYNSIGRTNYFLNNYNRAVNVPEEIRERYAAEAYFYRAFNYWLLTSLFGDVPYIVDELNVESPDVYRGRDPREKIIEAVTSDLEQHYKSLPEHIQAASSEFGRVSQCAALALLSRIYLHNGQWEKAVSAAERAMADTYHELYSTGHPEEDYVNLFNYKGRASRNASNKEVLLPFIYNFDYGSGYAHNLSRELWVYNQQARFVPSKAIVETYLTDDGKIWDPSGVTSYEQVFEHRDPRMKQTILAPGTPWTGGQSGDIHSTDPSVYTYPLFSQSGKGCMTYSGYYMRKYVEPAAVLSVGHDDNDIIMLRYAEVLLNYAEAKMELGQLDNAALDKSVNLIRKRVGMVPLTLETIPEGSDLRKEIQRERTVEFYFEGHRRFDLIRWKQGDCLKASQLGVRKDWIDESRIYEGEPEKSFWKRMNFETVIENGTPVEYICYESSSVRKFEDPKHYLFPIPFKQRQMNPNLEQNVGW